MDMRSYWLRDRALQKQFYIYWEPGSHNLADLPTKHHAVSHYRRLRPIYIYDKEKTPVSIQGCIKLLTKPSKIPADRKTTRTAPHPYITHLCKISQLSQSQPQIMTAQKLTKLPKTEALIQRKPVGPNRHLVAKVTRILQKYISEQLSREITHSPHNIE